MSNTLRDALLMPVDIKIVTYRICLNTFPTKITCKNFEKFDRIVINLMCVARGFIKKKIKSLIPGFLENRQKTIDLKTNVLLFHIYE